MFFVRRALLGLLTSFACCGVSHADIVLQTIRAENGSAVIVLSGEFSHSDSPDLLRREVMASGAKLVTFDSNGGNVFAAIEYGRMIRSLGLSTIQLRSSECVSACALAFVGGNSRQAEPGAIGVHQTSFSADTKLDGRMAVAAVQANTAEIMSYLIEMGVDIEVLRLSLSVPSDDMRYLTASEMQAYRITHEISESKSNVITDDLTKTTRVPLPNPKPIDAPEINTDVSNENKARAFVHSYHAAWSKENYKALSFMRSVYEENVNFYGDYINKIEVLNKKREFAERWPVRAYSVRHESVTVHCSRTCEIIGIVDWFAKRNIGNKVSSGEAQFLLTWDPDNGTILSEGGKVIALDKNATGPLRLVSQWADQNSECRGGSGDNAETLAACERREAIGEKLEAVGWCYGRDGEFGYQMEWHACDGTSSNRETPASSDNVTGSHEIPDPSNFPPRSKLTGKLFFPTFGDATATSIVTGPEFGMV